MNFEGYALVTADLNQQDRQEEKTEHILYSNFLSSCFLSHFWLCANKDQFLAYRHSHLKTAAPATQFLQLYKIQ